ncbi:MAG TPA: AAA family ATPase [Candidatus Dormibacteraeota bacterium]|nr:AAA family ATPase [Candidatus Dormibacteraeota bacterium]
MIKGVVLTNFMSYENSYVPLQTGLNLICGPNGAGKSSILLAISLVLGQAYTERSKRLSDLIRWGTDEARVTLILDNSGEKKPFPYFHTELVTVTRVIRKNGTYYYLLQNKPVPKTAVTDVFQSWGLNPDNILVIMHQFMVGRFAAVTPQDKLKMLEEAVGFQSYREEVLDARKRLENVMSEEQSLVQVLESTKETHDFWKREYDRYLQKRQLEAKLESLKHELLWSRIQKKRDALAHIETRIESKARALQSIEDKIQELSESKKKRQAKYDELNLGRIGLEDEKVERVKQITTQELNIQWATNLLSQFQQLHVATETPSTDLTTKDLDKLRLSWKGTAQESQRKLEREKERMTALSERIADVSGRLEDALTRLIDTNVEYEVSGFKRKLLTEELADLQAQLRLAKEELDPMVASAAKSEPPNESPRKIFDIMIEIGAVEEQMKPLTSLSEDVERMYSSYAKVYEELKAKADQVAVSRQEIMSELDKRLSRWRDVLSNFLEELTGRYSEILKAVSATGGIRLISSRDIEKCGLEILVGYKGNNPTALDAFTQSGGERSIAMMAFLLALQQHITSPFRAIDEFDVHMDPKNRESVTQLIMSNAAAITEGQYLAITPGQLNVTNHSHVIVVQNVGGTSLVSELK